MTAPLTAPLTTPVDTRGADWKARLRELGSTRYHHRHPFNALMHAGRLDAGDLRLWVANRYYYQTRIPIKDALILAKAEDREFRRIWIERILDHDGRRGQHPGGLELWVRLGRAVGLTRRELESHRELLPAVERACDDYVELVRRSDLVTAVASSLTEYFAGNLMQARIDAWRRHYPEVADEALRYFEERISRSAEDALFALEFVDRHATTPAQIACCLEAFEQKCRILWRLLSAVYMQRRRHRRPRLAARAVLAESAGRPSTLLAPERALELNSSAVALLERASGEATLGQIVDALFDEHEVRDPEAALDVATFVGELEVRRLIEFEGHPSEGRQP